MSNKVQYQNEDLKDVSGGAIGDRSYTTCKNCQKIFDISNAKSKTVGGGCNKSIVYKCPRCGKWVYGNGDVYGD